MAEAPGGGGPGAKGAVEVVDPGAVEAANARRVAESKATIPHLYLEAVAGLPPQSGAGPEHMIRACAIALGDFPRLNGSYRDGRFELHSRINLGTALFAQDSVLFPTIFDAAEKDATAIAAELAAHAERARSGVLTQPELSGATFSLADLSESGISRGWLAVNRGQAAILTVGAPAPGSRALCLSADHRIVRANDGASFLGRVAELLAGVPGSLA